MFRREDSQRERGEKWGGDSRMMIAFASEYITDAEFTVNSGNSQVSSLQESFSQYWKFFTTDTGITKNLLSEKSSIFYYPNQYWYH